MSGKQKGDGKPNKNKNRANNKDKSKPQQEHASKSNQKHKEKERTTQNSTVKPVCETPIRTDPSKDDSAVQSSDVVEETPTPIQGKYSRRKIESNWTKPDLPENIYDAYESTSHGANFQELFNMPMKFGDHFEFKSEKNWSSESKKIESNDLFELDYKALGEYVSCVPFYKILGLERSMFPEHQVENMEKIAEQRKLKLLSSSKALKPVEINLGSFETHNLFDSNDFQESKNSNTNISVDKKPLEVKSSFTPVISKNETASYSKEASTNSVPNLKDSLDNSDDELDKILTSSEISAEITKLTSFQPSTTKKISLDTQSNKRTISNDLKNIVQLSNQLSSSIQSTLKDDEEDLEEWLNDHLKM